MSKITLATFKKFVKNNKNNLYIKCDSRFDGMTDCVEYDYNAEFCLARYYDASDPHEKHMAECSNTLGIAGVWLVLGSRDRFSEYHQNGFKGIQVYNTCGSFVVAVKE